MSTTPSQSQYPSKPPQRGDKFFYIVVNIAGVMRPASYRYYGPTKPNTKQLKKLGVNYHRPRGDKILVEQISQRLWDALTEGQWIRL